MATFTFAALLLILFSVCSKNRVVLCMEPHFYDKSCPIAESTIFSVVQQHYHVDKSVAPTLIRLLLHDCFVRGCDASILLKSTPHISQTERDASPNLSLRKAFDLISTIKETLEHKCPRIVSCADIIAIAARDSVSLAGGQHYELLLGRHDGMISLASEALTMLPDKNDSLPEALAIFEDKGFTAEEFVALLGAHTIGTTQCSFVDDRLFNYQGTGKADPSMAPSFLQSLKKICTNSQNRIPLDQGTPFTIDNSYFQEITEGRAVLAIDNEVAQQGTTKQAAARYAHNNAYFQTFFEHSMKKLSMLNVLTHGGEIRSNCNQVNS